MNIFKKLAFASIAVFSIATAQTLFAEPPDTQWTVTGTSTLTITEVVEDGVKPWIFTLPKAGGRLDRSQKGSSVKLNFRTLVPLLPSGCKITYVQESAFKQNETIEELYWPDTITSITKNSFLTCKKLRICDYPEGVRMTSVGSSAFQECASLTRFRMSDTITSLGEFAFYQCGKIVFDGPMLPSSLTGINGKVFTVGESATPLQDGLLVIGGSGGSFTWTPANNNTSNKYFNRFNITNLIFGAGVVHAGTNNYAGKDFYDPYASSKTTGSSITNVVVKNPGVFAFGKVFTATTTTSNPTTIRQYDLSGWVTGELVAHSTAYKTRILAPKNNYWQEFKNMVTPDDYCPWNELDAETKAKYWENFTGGVEGGGDDIPDGIIKAKTVYALTVDNETLLPLTIPKDVWIVFKPGVWPEQMVSIQIPVAVTGLAYTGSEQTGVAEGEGYTLEGNKATEAGFYTATATLKPGYKWSDGTEEVKTIEWSIGIVQIPVAVEGLKYTGSEQTGVLEGEGYTIEGNKATEVGTYTATATLKDNFVWSDGTKDVKKITWEISSYSIPIPTAVTGLMYTGSEITGVLEGEGYTLEGNKATNVGTYTAKATLKEDYEWEDGTKEVKSITWTIEGTKIPVAVTGLRYNGKTQTGVKAAAGYTLTGNTGKDVGTYTATATLEAGYMWEDGTTEPKSITWSIGEEEREPIPDPLPAPEPDSVDTPSSIIYVNPAAAGANDGTSWTDAYTNFKTALGKITAEKNVIWLAGTFTCSADCVVTIPSGVKAKIRGGFKGTEVTAEEREDGVKSVVSGNVRAYKTLEITSDSALRIERIRFIDSRERGIYKKGEGDLTLVDCDVIGCGLTLGNVHGRGFVMTGTPGKTRFFAERCTFAGNRLGGGSSQYDVGSGHGAAFLNLARATLDDCLFVTNGLPILTAPGGESRGFRYFKGSALYATNAPVTVRGTKFLFNRACCSQEYDQANDIGLMGATVRLEAGTGGSAFTNCLWMANQNSRLFNSSTWISRGGGGELFFNPGKTYAECEVVNCSFAANLNHISKNGGCGVNVRSGKMKILNSIFSDNISVVTAESVGKDIYVADGAEVNVSYSMLSPDKNEETPIFAAGPGTLNLGEGLVFDKANFVSRVDEARYMRSTSGAVHFYLPVALNYLLNLDVHLRSQAGYFDAKQNKRIRSYSENSPALDAGDPKSDYSKEPYTSWGHPGRRVNMGFYGNTPEAAATKYKGFFVKVVGGESAPKEEVEVIGRADNAIPQEDIIVCDGVGDSVKFYRGNEAVWKWTAKGDKAIPSAMSDSYFKGITEARISDYNGKKVVAISSSDCTWAIVDIATTNAIAYGYSRTAGQGVSTSIMPHSIIVLPNDIVAVASTYTVDQNSPETKYGCYFYHIAGDKATSYQDPGYQGATFFSIENPHGFYWDNDNKKLYVSSSEGLTRLSVTYNSEENKFDIVEEAVFGISQLGAKWGHDLAVVPGTRILAMTAYEMTLFFDMDKEEWLLDDIVWRMDIKGFDPHSDQKHILATVPRSGYVTDTLEVWTKENGFKEYLHVPGAEFYKARWAGGVLDSIAK